MKNLFEKNAGRRTRITFDKDWKLEGVVKNVFDQYVEIDTNHTGPEHIVYVQLAKIAECSFESL
jgi:hypothetical protein